MDVFYETGLGPQKCRVVREVDSEFVRLQPLRSPSGPFGAIQPLMAEFGGNKNLCWMKAKSVNKYGTRHEFSGRPVWALVE